NALAYINVTMLRAAFDDVYTRPGRVDSIRCGSEVTANDPMPLDTITSRGVADRRSSGRKVWVTRTGPSRFTPKTGRKSAGTVPTGSPKLPRIPALLTSTSRPVADLLTTSCAAV